MHKEPSEGSFEEPDDGVVIPPTKYYQADETRHYSSAASHKKPFEKPDDGVIIEPSLTGYQPVTTPENQEHMDTQPLEVIESGDEFFEETDDDVDTRYVYGPFRRHWREPLLRLVAPRYALKWYLPFVYGGLLTLVVSGIFEYATPDQSIHLGWFGLGLLLPSYPVGREIYRWRRRMVRLEWAGERIVITCYEPTSIFWGFTGSGNGDSWKFEGSTSFHLRITFVNRLIFWGCGNLIISGKVEGGRAPSLDNIPHVRRVRAFLNRPTEAFTRQGRRFGMDTVTAIWEWFASFPVYLAVGSMNVVILLYVLTALAIVFWRHNPKLSVVTLMVPLGLYGVAWLVRLAAEWEVVAGGALATGLWIFFSLLMLMSLIWAAINLIRVLANK